MIKTFQIFLLRAVTLNTYKLVFAEQIGKHVQTKQLSSNTKRELKSTKTFFYCKVLTHSNITTS